MRTITSFHMLQAICIIFLFNYGMRIQADIFTAIAEFEYVIKAHKTIKDYLDTYIKRHEKRLAVIKSYSDVFKREHRKAMSDVSKYLENPVNKFTLIKRLTVDLNFIKYSIEDETAYIDDITNKQYADKYPTMEDIQGAAEALVRLQNVYNLEAHELAEGKLNTVDDSTPMTASDCYEIGRILYYNKEIVDGLEWMLEAYRKYNIEGIHYEFSDKDILEDISFGYSETGDMESALYWIQKLYDIDPHNSRARKIEKKYQNNMKYSKYSIWLPPHRGSWWTGMSKSNQLKPHEVPLYVSLLQGSRAHPRKEVTEQSNMKTETNQLQDSEEFLFHSLCRGDLELPIEISSRLTCHYQTENHPFTKIAPIKAEMLHLNPDIVLFHDVLSDGEIDNLVESTKRRLLRSKVIPINISKHRISKSALCDEESDVVVRISRRITHMTGLSLKSSDDLHVTNYGIAGFYDLHNDDFYDCILSKDKGKRIATVMFYMSNVTKGGATVFPELGVSIFPVKGSAIYWLNLHPSGERNDCMLHGACPVLTGSKWIATKWINEVGQEFIKPCSLEYQEESCYLKRPERSFNDV